MKKTPKPATKLTLSKNTVKSLTVETGLKAGMTMGLGLQPSRSCAGLCPAV